ncbi:hypothetical protein L6452_05377 [Arctium lappa]|uniref:Uncharacterized protein n=1 Tax=Arctium lappa TaxID=4217 RepID=A0ACB9EFW1_ARCLA|nr:hypothetical protein L6452_05377 [Arctium lappa]
MNLTDTSGEFAGKNVSVGKSDCMMPSSDEKLNTATASMSIKEVMKKEVLPPITKAELSEKSQGDTPKICIEVGSSSRVTRSQGKKKQTKIDITATKGEGSNMSTKRSTSPLERETQDNGKRHGRMEKGSSTSRRIKKSESTELEDGGFGLLPLINRVETRKDNTNATKMKDGIDDGQSDNQEKRAKELKIDAESSIHKGLAYSNEHGFNDLLIELNRLFKHSSASGERTPKSPMKKGFLSPCTDMVLSQQINDPLVVLWESPTYVREVDESMECTQSRACVSELQTDKGKAILFDEPSGPAAWVNETNASLPQSRPEDDKEKVKLIDPKKEECVKGRWGPRNAYTT